MMSPVLSAVASKLKGRVQVVKIDTDKYPAVASQHRVQVRSGWFRIAAARKPGDRYTDGIPVEGEV